MAKNKKMILLISIFGIMFCMAGKAEADLDALIEVGRSQADMKKHYDEETKNYKRAKAAFDSGRFVKGLPKSAVQGECGEPVVAFNDSEKRMEKWIYKPAASSFFAGQEITIFFDSSDTLVEAVFRNS